MTWLLFAAAEMTSEGIPKNKDGVPQWGGDPSSFQMYEEECLLWVETQAYHKRHMCVPKLKAELSGPARRLILGQSPGWGAHAGGVQELMSYLRQRLGRPQLPELSEQLLKYFRGTRRRAQETVNDYVTRKCEAYVRAQQSMQRVMKDRGVQPATIKTEDPGYRWSGGQWGGYGRRQSWDSNATTDAQETTHGGDGENAAAASRAAAPTAEDNGATETGEGSQDGWSQSQDSRGSWWNRDHYYDNGWSWGWSPSWSYYGGWSSMSNRTTEVSQPAMPELIPPFLQGWFLLQDSGLDVRERNVIQTALQGDFNLQRVAAELRAQWPETELQRRDRHHRSSTHRGEAYEAEEEEAETMEIYNQEELIEAGMSEEGLMIMEEAEEEIEGALAAIQTGKRTLKEARARQTEVRLSRKYYKPGQPGSNFRGQRCTSSTTSQGSRANRDEHMTCLGCRRKGHRVANCPDKQASAASVVPGAESAPIVCFAESHSSDCFSGAEQALSITMNTEEAMKAGMAVLDGGATKTLGSVKAMEALMAKNKAQDGNDGILGIDPRNRPTFSFGNSSVDQVPQYGAGPTPSWRQRRMFEGPHFGPRPWPHPDVNRGPEKLEGCD